MRILLADDHDLVRDSLALLLAHYSADIVVTAVADLHAAISILRKNTDHDLVIIDLEMPGMNGLLGLKQLRDEWPQLPIVLMSGAATDGDVAAALDMGIRGFLPKTIAGRALVQALELVMAGEIFLPATWPGRKRDASNLKVDKPMTLTERERQVIEMLKEGLANKEIAKRLGVQEVTVKLHVRTASNKLGARNRTDLLMKAIKRGLIE